jgi:DNA-binding NarL/FixJ family response regulator
MPGTSGLDVAAELMSIRPDMSVVLTSGYVTDDLKARASRAGIRHVIYKPNSVKELCDAVQQVLREQEKL